MAITWSWSYEGLASTIKYYLVSFRCQVSEDNLTGSKSWKGARKRQPGRFNYFEQERHDVAADAWLFYLLVL